MRNLLKILSLFVAASMLAACHFPTRSTYTNTAYGFQLQYPPGSSIVIDTPTAARIQLPITPGTNLMEKYLDIAVAEGDHPCSSPNAEGWAPGSFVSQNLTINGLDFVKEIAGEGAAGSIYEWTAYSTARGSVNLSLIFVLHSHPPDAYPTPLQTFDQEAESAVFLDVAETFNWPSPFIGTPPLLIDLAPIKAHCMVHKARADTFDTTPSLTPTATGSTIFFTPHLNAYCRSSPDRTFDSITLAMKGQAYPIDGRTAENDWYFLRISPNVECWVLASTGEASGDTSGVQVYFTRQVEPAPPEPERPLNQTECSHYMDPQTCSQHPGCTWNRMVTPGVCQNK